MAGQRQILLPKMIHIIRRKRTIFKWIIIFGLFLSLYILGLFVFEDNTQDSPLPSEIVLKRGVRFVQDFQKIGNGSQKLYVYSSYCVKNPDGNNCYIIVLGGLLSEGMKPIYCQLYTDDGNSYYRMRATLRPLSHDNMYFDLPYQPYYIFCGTDREKSERPAFVSIVLTLRDNEIITNLLPIKYKDDDEKYKFAVCVQPTFNYDEPLKFAEWVEYYRLMGVEKFSLYNMSIGPMTSCVIKSYGDLIEVLPWTSPYEDEVEIRVNGQFIASHDCLVRYKGVADYLIIVDLDEMIMPAPLVGDNFSEMIRTFDRSLALRNISKTYVSGYIFVTAIFFDTYTDDKTLEFWTVEGNKQAESVLKEMSISRKIEYTKFRNGYRPDKYIVIPDKAVEISAHTIVQGVRNARSVNVPFDMAYNHHYRSCRGDMSQVRLCKNSKRKVEASGQRFGKKVAIEVADRLYNKATECSLPLNFDY